MLSMQFVSRVLYRSTTICAVVVCLGFLTGCTTYETIATGLPEKEANEIYVLLASRGISVEKTQQVVTGAGGGAAADEGTHYTIAVPTNQLAEALLVLNRHGLPRTKTATLLSLFAKSGLVSTAQEEQIRYQEGLADKIANAIRRMDGVIDAQVFLASPQVEEGLGETEKVPTRASVYVKHEGIADDPNSQLVTKIKLLVSNSVVDLDYDNVTVVTDRTGYGEMVLGPEYLPDIEREYVSIWSVVVAKDSVSRFRGIFFGLCLAIAVLAVLLAWLVWKSFPMIQHAGGFSRLFTSVRPLALTEKEPKEESEEEEWEEEGPYEEGGR